MPKRGLISLIFTIAGLRLIVGYVPPVQAGIGGISPDPSVNPDPSASASAEPTPTSTATPTPTPTPAATPKPTTPDAATAHNGTYTGSTFDYNYGTMQVTVTVSGGKVSGASVSQSGRWAIGYRKAACTEAVFNSAAIDLSAGAASGSDFMAKIPSACSGATYSWWGYANSLQAAIDKAIY